MQNYLSKRGARYFYRRRLPLDLIGHYQGRKELTKALNTSDRHEAARLARAMAVQHDKEFEAFRSGQQQANNGQIPGALTGVFTAPPADQSNNLPPRIPYTPPQSAGPLVGDREAEAHAILAHLRKKRTVAEAGGSSALKDFMTMTNFGLAFHEMVLSGGEESNRPMWWHEAALMAHRAFLDGSGHSGISSPLKTQLAGYTQATVSSSADMGEPVMLDELVKLWRKDGSHSNVRTIEKAELVVRRFKEMVGDLSVQTITRKHCIAFRDSVLAAGKSIPTTNDHMDKLRALLSVAKARGLIQQNHAEGASLKDPTPKKEKRQPFDTPSLVRIFSSKVYSARYRPEGGAGEAAYWLPLLALYTGARLEELGQLHPDDVRSESYEDADGNTATAWVLWITDQGEGQRLKTQGSRRRIPLHAELTRLGFNAFVDQRRGHARIFYELKEDTRDRETGRWSKWFGRWLRGKHCGVSDTRMVFHSFRHGFKDMCRDAGMHPEVSDALTGHSGDGSVSRTYGSDQYPLKPLAEAMQRFKLPVEVQNVLAALPKYHA